MAFRQRTRFALRKGKTSETFRLLLKTGRLSRNKKSTAFANPRSESLKAFKNRLVKCAGCSPSYNLQIGHVALVGFQEDGVNVVEIEYACLSQVTCQVHKGSKIEN